MDGRESKVKNVVRAMGIPYCAPYDSLIVELESSTVYMLHTYLRVCMSPSIGHLGSRELLLIYFLFAQCAFDIN